MPRQYVTIETGHVGKPAFQAFGRSWLCCNFIGRILPQDVGKRVYLIDGILQVENDAQRLTRHQREATAAMQALGADQVAHLSADPQDHRQADGAFCPHPLATCPHHGKVRDSAGILDNPNMGGSILPYLR